MSSFEPLGLCVWLVHRPGGSQSMRFLALRVTVIVVTFCAMGLATRCFWGLRRLFLGVTLRARK